MLGVETHDETFVLNFNWEFLIENYRQSGLEENRQPSGSLAFIWKYLKTGNHHCWNIAFHPCVALTIKKE